MENIYTDDMKDLVLSRQDFASFRKKNRLYVDKTEYAYRLAKEKEGFYFISRPRRFGKSLFCSMLEALFEGRKELFEGLYIAEKTDYDFEKLPVLSFNLAKVSSSTFGRFISSLTKAVYSEAARNGVEIEETDDPAQMLQDALSGIFNKTGKKVVIIIDEYDNNITENIEEKDRDTAEEMRKVLNDFFKMIKNSSEYISFCFITGVVKLSHLSIFSAMNNLVDLTMDEDFAVAFGYTDEEFDEYFSEGIDEYLEANPGKYESRAEFRQMIKEYYDGYRFSPDSETTVYNPVSIGFFFENKCRFRNYWHKTGRSTIAIKLAKHLDLSSAAEDTMIVQEDTFDSFDVYDIAEENLSIESIGALLYFSGYLTIRDYDFPDITMAFPNTEVASSFTDNLLKLYARKKTAFDSWAKKFYRACASGDDETVRTRLTEYFDAFSYELIGDEKEKFFHAIFHAVFILAGVYAITEDRGLIGRADEVIIASDFLWIFELKVDGSADDALRQIEEKGYAKKYASMTSQYNLNVRKVGISFSSATKSIAEWKTE